MVYFAVGRQLDCLQLGAFTSHTAGVLDSFLGPENPMLSCLGVLVVTCFLCPGPSHCLHPAHLAASAPSAPCTVQRLRGIPAPASSTGPHGTIPQHSFIHAHTHAFTHTCIHSHTHAFTHTCIHAHIHAHTHSFVHTCMHSCMHSCTHTCSCTHSFMHTCMHSCTHSFIHVHTHALMHAFMYTFIHAHTHAFMHTFIHAHMHALMHTLTRVHSCTHTCIQAHTHSFMHTHMHSCAHAFMRTRMHACMCWQLLPLGLWCCRGADPPEEESDPLQANEDIRPSRENTLNGSTLSLTVAVGTPGGG